MIVMMLAEGANITIIGDPFLLLRASSLHSGPATSVRRAAHAGTKVGIVMAGAELQLRFRLAGLKKGEGELNPKPGNTHLCSLQQCSHSYAP